MLLNDSLQDVVGKHLSHYYITAEIGRGGMGIVYRATDTKLDRTVAIKVLPAAALAIDEDRARFYREAKAAAALTHPHIAIIHAVDEAVPEGASSEELRPFIAMEYIDGETLEARIKKGPLKLEEAVRLASEIASALKLAHENEIVHRDIKSANVMLTTDGSVKVLDFGLAQTAASTKLTRLGSTLGTVAYMSPEQARGEAVDGRTDIWSLGAVLYEMIAGELAFLGDYEQAVVYTILNQDPEPLTAVRSGVPMELERIVEKCLAKEARLRYQHCDDLIADLEGIDAASLKRGSGSRSVTAESTDGLNGLSVPLRQKKWFLPASFIITAVLASLATWLVATSNGISPSVRVTSMTRVTIEPTTEMYPSIHPAGDRIVYAAGKTDDMRLYYRLIKGGPPIRLVENSDQEENYPTYSPDGNRVLFHSGGTIYSVEALGGIPRPFIRPDPATDIYEYPTWSPAGDAIAYVSNAENIHILKLGENSPTLTVPFNRAHSLSWSPDGKYLAVVKLNTFHARRGNNIAPTSIWLLSATDGTRQRITTDEYMDLSPRWAPDASALFFISNQNGRLDIYRQPLSTDGSPAGPSEQLTTGLNLFSIDVSKDGSQLVAVELNYRQNIWASDLHSTTLELASDAIPITSGDQVIEGVAISQDGTRLAFDSNARGLAHLFMMPLSGGMPFQITSRSEPDFLYDWSPYSDELSFHTFSSGTRDVGIVSEDGLTMQTVADGPDNELWPFWLIDENTMAYHVFGDTDVENQLVLVRRDSSGEWGEREVIIDDLLIGARWSVVRNRVAYFSGEILYLWDPETGESERVADVSEVKEIDTVIFGASASLTWSVDGSMIYFKATDAKKNQSFWEIATDGGSPRKIVDLTGRVASGASAAVDEHRIYYTFSEIESDIWVLNLARSAGSEE